MKAITMVATAIAAMSLFAVEKEDKVGEAIAGLFKDKTAVITGAASGMGLCTSKTLAAAGATVFMCDINEEGVKKAADEINALGIGPQGFGGNRFYRDCSSVACAAAALASWRSKYQFTASCCTIWITLAAIQ